MNIPQNVGPNESLFTTAFGNLSPISTQGSEPITLSQIHIIWEFRSSQLWVCRFLLFFIFLCTCWARSSKQSERASCWVLSFKEENLIFPLLASCGSFLGFSSSVFVFFCFGYSILGSCSVFQTRIHPERKDWVWWSGGFVFLTNPSKGERERERERERETINW
jgi:hypothetical protein